MLRERKPMIMDAIRKIMEKDPTYLQRAAEAFNAPLRRTLTPVLANAYRAARDAMPLRSNSICPNLNAEPIRVKHADLKRVNEESMYRSHCPVCKNGVLLVNRNQTTYALLREDRCITCGQAIIYEEDGIGGELFGFPPEIVG